MDTGINVTTRGRTVEIVLDRAPVNAIAVETYEALTVAFRETSKRTDIHAVILRAEGKLFSAGADLKQPADSDSLAETGPERRQRIARTCYEAILDCSLPTIAVVQGAAMGAGAVLAACCDIRYASTEATFVLPEIRAGRCGGGRHLMRMLPQGETRLMYFTGEPLDAEDAYRFGFVQRIATHDRVLDKARTLADSIAEKSPLGLRLAKQALNEAEVLPVKAGYAAEQKYTIRLAEHPDAAEAARAVLEKRTPAWSWPAVPES